jgi:hypothetical protein
MRPPHQHNHLRTGKPARCLGRERVLSREATIGTEKGAGHESGLESADHLLAIGV